VAWDKYKTTRVWFLREQKHTRDGLWPGNPLDLWSLGFPGPKTITRMFLLPQKPHSCGFIIVSYILRYWHTISLPLTGTSQWFEFNPDVYIQCPAVSDSPSCILYGNIMLKPWNNERVPSHNSGENHFLLHILGDCPKTSMCIGGGCQAFQLHVFHTVIQCKEYRMFPKLAPKKCPQISNKKTQKNFLGTYNWPPWSVFCTSKC
jgi:hypothetical protein